MSAPDSWFGTCADPPSTTGVWDNLASPCSRRVLVTVIPAGLAVLFALFQILFGVLSRVPASYTPRVVRWVKAPFRTFISLEQAELYAATETEKIEINAQRADTRPRSSYTLQVLLVLGSALGQVLTRLAFAIYTYVDPSTTLGSWSLSSPYIPTWQILCFSSIPFIYIAISLLLAPPKGGTPPYATLVLTIIELPAACIILFGPWYDAVDVPQRVTLLNGLNLAIVLGMLGTIMTMPVGIPGPNVDEPQIGTKISPEDYCALWRWVTFRWVFHVIKRGTNRKLEDEDVWELSPTLQTRPVFKRFTELKGSTLLRTILAANSLDSIIVAELTLVSVFFSYSGPFFLNRILSALDSPGADLRTAYLFAILTLLTGICKTQSDLHHLWISRRCSIRVRTELTAAIYDKALKRKDFSGVVQKENKKEEKKEKGKKKGKADPGKASAGADIGKIVQLFQQDTTRISMLLTSISVLYSAPFEIFLAMTFLYNLLGISAFAGVFVLLIAVPINYVLTKRTRNIQKELTTARDNRTTVINEVVMSIKFIKFFAWEERWMGRAMDKRNEEIRWLIKMRLNGILLSLVWGCVPVLVSISAFASFVLLGNELTVAIAFTSIALFGMLRGPLNSIPGQILFIIQAAVSLQRIDTFLQEPEVDDAFSALKVDSPDDGDDELGVVENASFVWNTLEEDSNKPTQDGDGRRFELRDINVVFPQGKLTLITGPTASGKSALLMAILGEMTPTPGSKGRVLLSKKGTPSSVVSYCAQTPWLQHSTIRENILFGLPMDEKRYDDVVECCALQPDLAIFEDGDQTEIGIRGVSLSGGQKARVALARAVYAPTKYVLLDDPLSAVDSHTARFLFERLFQGPLLANRTVVLVTHHIELVLPAAYYLVSMLDGKIDRQGPVDDLDLKLGPTLVTRAEEETAVEGDKDEKKEDENENKASQTPKKLVKEEERQEGRVKWKVYRTYLEASSYWTWIILLVLVCVSQGLNVVEKIWLRVWGEAYKEVETFMPGTETFLLQAFEPLSTMVAPIWQTPSPYEHPLFFVFVYSAIGLGAIVISLCSRAVQITGGLRASRYLYKELLRAVVRATIRFHDTTPAGRILNRFSRDITIIDGQLANTLQQINQTVSTFAASLLVVSVIRPFFLIPAFFIGYSYISLAIRYLDSGRDLRRMESNSRSPIVSGFSEMLDGLVTVRAFSAERRFMNGLYEKLDLTTRMWYTYWMTNRWLLLNYDLLGAASVFITMIIALTGMMSAGLAGLMITSAMSFTTSIYWTCRYWTTLEVEVNAMERVVEYLELPQEPAAVIETNRPPAYWPSSSSGHPMLEVKDLVVKYAPDLPAVLQKVSFELSARERVGLIGRTGSGKSTLAMALLRFTEPAEGTISIDGIDITKIGVYDLRSRLTFIPQDATLFSGTIRDNLDPFTEYTDAELLDVLQRVHLLTPPKETVSGETSGSETDPGSSTAVSVVTQTDKQTVTLESKVSAGGTNFSQGQRQLIALGRALLRQSTLIIMDEATSSIDFDTDAKIQATIRDEFKNSLLLTIAHRLKTIIDYDRLVVLDHGRVAETGTPYELIQKEDGIFRNMCLNSGMFDELEEAAKLKSPLVA